MKNLSRFDLGMIIAFVIVALLGGGAWYYLSGQLATAQGDASTAAGEFDQYTKKEVYLPTTSNVKMLQANIDLMTAQLDPLVKNVLQASQNQLPTIQQTDTVQWKHQLDDEVKGLNGEAKISGIKVPDNFYYGFSRYLNTNPELTSTVVLSRQLLGVKEIADILIKAPVHAIVRVKRTYEEDPAAIPGAPVYQPTHPDLDQLAGRSQEAPGGVYTAYPFEVEFDAKTESFRKVIDDLMQSHYVFVIRSVLVQNSKLVSPKVQDLDTMAGPNNNNNPSPDASVVNSSPGATAAATPTVGVQYLFGDETLHVRMRIDLIDWHGVATAPTTPTGNGRGGRGNGAGGQRPAGGGA